VRSWNYRWIAIAVAWFCALAGWLFVYSLPNTYGASTVVYVDTQSVLRPLLRGLSVETDVMNEVTVMTRAIVSRPNLESVARAIDLDVKSTSTVEYERRLKELEDRINLSRDREGVFSISYEDTDRATALKVVENLLNTFVENTLGSNQEDSAQAETTLKAQLDDYEKRMRAAEDRLTQFKQKNVGLMPGERGDYYQQLQAAKSELAGVDQQLRVERQKLSTLQKQIVGEEPVFGIMTPVGGGSKGSSLDARIAELKRHLSELSIEYTDKHPEVVRTKSLLDELTARRDEEQAAMGDSAGPVASSPLDLNPVYQNMKIQLGDSQVEIARLQALRDENKANVDRLEKLVNVVPKVEAELARLNRDYDVVKQRYQEMLERWENLQTSKRVRAGSEGVKFRVLEPPYAPLQPSGPPRGLMVLGVAVLSVGLGLGLTVLTSLFRPVFLWTGELRRYALPVIGTITMTRSPEDDARSRRHMAIFIAVTTGLFITAAFAAYYAGPASELFRQLA
jgi:polysaccharide chain length determinant protein (PEP-CTERM system associated)